MSSKWQRLEDLDVITHDRDEWKRRALAAEAEAKRWEQRARAAEARDDGYEGNGNYFGQYNG